MNKNPFVDTLGCSMSSIQDYVEKLFCLGFKVLPVGTVDHNGVFNPKNPGVFQSVTWTPGSVMYTLGQDPRLGLAIKLSMDGMIDIESDTEEADRYAEILFAGVETISWRSIGSDSHFPGVHRLFTLSESQVEIIASAGRKVWPVPGLDVRLHGISVIPPSGGRKWWKSPGDSTVSALPNSIFETLTAGFESKAEPAEGVTGTPGHAFCFGGPSWGEILEPHGWTMLPGGSVRRPGKDHGISGTVGVCTSPTRGELLYVFSTSPQIAPLLPGQSYSKFEAYAFLEHSGAFGEASKALRSKGYGGSPDVVSVFETYPEPADDSGRTADDSGRTADDSGRTADEEPPKPVEFMELSPDLMWNVIGEYVLGVKDSTEFDATSIYFQALEMFGALVGRNAFYEYEVSRKFLSDYLIVVGETGSGKGVTFDYAKRLFVGDEGDMFLEPAYSTINIGRVGSGEGLIKTLMEREGPEFHGGAQYERCLLCTDQEGVGALKKTFYDGSTLVDALLKAWDFNTLSNTTTSKTLLARNPLVTLIWHIVPSVLGSVPQDYFRQGLMSRMKFIHCRKPLEISRSRGPSPDVVKASRERMAVILTWISEEPRKLVFDAGAGDLMFEVARFQHGLEGTLSEAHPRYAAHVERMACRLALLDMTSTVSERHVQVAWGLQKLAFDHTEKFLSRFRADDPENEMRETVLSFLSDNSGQMFTLTQLRKQAFSGSSSVARIRRAVNDLIDSGMVSKSRGKTRNGHRDHYSVN